MKTRANTKQITEAQFVAAQKYQEAHGWPLFSEAQGIIDRYRKQNQETRHGRALRQMRAGLGCRANEPKPTKGSVE